VEFKVRLEKIKKYRVCAHIGNIAFKDYNKLKSTTLITILGKCGQRLNKFKSITLVAILENG